MRSRLRWSFQLDARCTSHPRPETGATMSRATRPLAVVLAALLPLACGPSGQNQSNGPGDLISVSVALDIVPTGVQCLRLTIAMGALVERQLFPVTAGQSTRLQVTGLSAGPATFSGDTFDFPCNAVTG